MEKRIHPAILILILILVAFTSEAQLSLGLSANFGNQLRFSSSQGMKSSLMPSGGVLVSFKQELQHDWAIVYGGGVGVLGYSMRVQLNEPNQSDPFAFPEYNSVYGDINLLIGKQLHVGKRKILVGIGGGGTYFYTLNSLTDYAISEIAPDGTRVEKFESQIQVFNKLIGLGKVGIFLPMNKLLTVGLTYSYHFSSVLNGVYQFKNGSNSSSGTVSLHPNELSLIGTIRISRIKKL